MVKLPQPFNPFPNKRLFLSACRTSLSENNVGKGEIVCD